MNEFSETKVAVIGLDASGIAACKLLKSQGARVCAVQAEGVHPSQKETAELGALGIQISPENSIPDGTSLAVHCSGVSRKSALVQEFVKREIEVISDLELAGRGLFCLSVAICGTNGKTTTAELVAQMLAGAQRKTTRAGASGAPVCGIPELSRELDFVTLDVNSFQLESIEHFRPSVAVVTNIRGDHMDKYSNLAEYAQVIGRVFKSQQVFDWAIVQSEALAHLRSLGVEIPSKVITFSSQNRRADLYLDRGLLISSLANWCGPLFNMEQCALPGPHHAENAMAALAVGRVLRLNLEQMIGALKAYRPGPHRLELVREIEGVRYVNNSKAMNVAAVQQSIEAIPPGLAGEPNIWLIAGGRDKMLDYHELGPVLAQRVKGAFLLGESRQKLRAAWSLFTPCTLVNSLLEAVSEAARSAAAGDYVLLSPAGSSLDMFQSYQHRGEKFREAVGNLAKNADKTSSTDHVRACSTTT
ncbi:MAG TPA: UDP-N-acetylmuramoyl-L-alanine--D-glutamate ligase [Verrucomicrobiae bacterium]|nr:UDP-N-acetylmuramoyl-L-alanine--D-glutamate ligase [Verrucomicrobiae bacterium]